MLCTGLEALRGSRPQPHGLARPLNSEEVAETRLAGLSQRLVSGRPQVQEKEKAVEKYTCLPARLQDGESLHGRAIT